MITLEHVTFQYPDATAPLIGGLSLSLEKGAIGILTGDGGCGKTTLVHVLSGELQPTSGRIEIAGFDLRHLKPIAANGPTNLLRYRQAVGFVFQDFKLLADKTIFENVAFALEVMPKQGRHDLYARVDRVLGRLGLSQVRDSFPHSLSHGELARAAIARAVVREPYVLIADEPTTQLDARASAEILEILEAEHRRGMTVLILTSNESIASGEAERFKMRRVDEVQPALAAV